MATPIEIKGIVRSQSKLAVEDGAAEDLLNLRFKDGSWRTSGNGKQVFNIAGTGSYSQLYVHTNAPYKHLLGVKGGKLWWFANISADGVFESLYIPQPLCSVADGDIYITQTGHLLTIIDSAEDFEYVVFKTSSNEYKSTNYDTNGDQASIKLFPYGFAHFNLYEPVDVATNDYEQDSHSYFFPYEPYNESKKSAIIKAYSTIKSKDKFTRPFLAVCAIKLYDGTYAYATNPVLLYPRQRTLDSFYSGYNDSKSITDIDPKEKTKYVYHDGSIINRRSTDDVGNEVLVGYQKTNVKNKKTGSVSTYTSSDSTTIGGASTAIIPDYMQPILFVSDCLMSQGETSKCVVINGSDIVLSINKEAADIIKKNGDVFTSVCVFITPEIDDVNLSTERDAELYNDALYGLRRNDDNVVSELMHEQFYLLREYKVSDIDSLIGNPIVDLTSPLYAGILSNIRQQKTLTYESMSRTTFVPKTAFSYNGKLHVADYKSIQFHGFPFDQFNLNNHSVKLKAGSKFMNVLDNLSGNNDNALQIEKYIRNIINDGLSSSSAPTVIIKTTLTTSSGEQVVCRYIEAVNDFKGKDYIEDLSPVLSFPDSRADKMTIYYIFQKVGTTYHVKYKEFKLTAHPYLNMSYYIDKDLCPIRLDDFNYVEVGIAAKEFAIQDLFELTEEDNTEEYYPNGLKVSSTNNPMYFPVEQTYQVGNGRIVAMCSNTIAVGTGQTGAAPLYVFCTDGVYAMFVDSFGEMAYSNARVLARDVCNNAKSVTPIDTGVVFTTDRGLMMIAGETVEEIGQPCEGEPLLYSFDSRRIYNPNFGKKLIELIAKKDTDICDGVNFLHFLRGCIINYNHNERELMVSNPTMISGTLKYIYPYTYVMDRNGQWSRRDFSASEYVNDFPTSYRLQTNSNVIKTLFKVDEEPNQLAGVSEADNGFIYFSNIIKLGGTEFKKGLRLVVRGKFERLESDDRVGLYVLGSYDGEKFSLVGVNEKSDNLFTDIGCIVNHTSLKYIRIVLAGRVTGKSRIDFIEIDGRRSLLSSKLR